MTEEYLEAAKLIAGPDYDEFQLQAGAKVPSGYTCEILALNREGRLALEILLPSPGTSDPRVTHIPVDEAIRRLGHEV